MKFIKSPYLKGPIGYLLGPQQIQENLSFDKEASFDKMLPPGIISSLPLQSPP